jgi:hypothetical protein
MVLRDVMSAQAHIVLILPVIVSLSSCIVLITNAYSEALRQAYIEC